VRIYESDVPKLRRMFGLSQEGIGALAGVSGALICQIEAGKKPLTDRVSTAIVDELELTPDKFSRLLTSYEEFSLTSQMST
jgi:predicted transcriptional regulator